MAEFVSFAQVKEQVSMQQVLEHYGLLEGLRVQKGGEELVGICPFHEEKTGSFHVSLAKNKNGAYAATVSAATNSISTSWWIELLRVRATLW